MYSRAEAQRKSFFYKNFPVAAEIAADPLDDASCLKVCKVFFDGAIGFPKYAANLSSCGIGV